MPATLAHRFTVRDYYRLAKVGFLDPDKRYELLEGEIFEMFPIGPFHGYAVGDLTSVFNAAAKKRWAVLPASAMTLDKHSEPQPDLLLVRAPLKRYKAAHPKPEDIFLAIEVSDSSLSRDRKRKLPLYAKFGVPELWIVNLKQRQIEIYREPNYLGYAHKEIIKEGTVAPAAFPDAKVNVTELLH